MTLRTTAIIAGVLGLLMLVTGLIANAVRAEREVITEQPLDTPVVVLSPEVLALPGIERIAVNGDGGLDANTARTVDAEAWLKRYTATYVLGYEDWDSLSTRTESRVTATVPSPSPTAEADATEEAPAADDAGTASPGATAEATAGEDGATKADERVADYGSADLWRHSWHGESRVAVTGSTLAVGETLVVFTTSGDPLTSIQFYAQRDVNDEWISPLMWVGAALTLLGVVAALSALIDIRPLQARIETLQRRRSSTVSAAPRPGSRRERRLAGSTLPVVSLDEPDGAQDSAEPGESDEKEGER